MSQSNTLRSCDDVPHCFAQHHKAMVNCGRLGCLETAFPCTCGLKIVDHLALVTYCFPASIACQAMAAAGCAHTRMSFQRPQR